MDAKDNKTERCEEHQKEHDKELNRQRQKAWYDRQKLKS